jgi:uncharacterized damage-inducible protein DinB
MTKDDILTLYDYNAWANGQVTKAAAALGREAVFSAPTPGRESLGGTLVHILAVEWMWRQRCQYGVSPPRYVPAERFVEPESIPVAWAEEERAMRAFLQTVGDERVRRPVHYASRAGEPRRMLLWHVFVQLVNHGTQHRAEAALRLAELGRDPGDLGFLLFLERG